MQSGRKGSEESSRSKIMNVCEREREADRDAIEIQVAEKRETTIVEVREELKVLVVGIQLAV